MSDSLSKRVEEYLSVAVEAEAKKYRFCNLGTKTATGTPRPSKTNPVVCPKCGGALMHMGECLRDMS